MYLPTYLLTYLPTYIMGCSDYKQKEMVTCQKLLKNEY